MLAKRIPSTYKIFTPHDRALAKTLLFCSRSYKTDPPESSQDNKPVSLKYITNTKKQKTKLTDLQD